MVTRENAFVASHTKTNKSFMKALSLRICKDFELAKYFIKYDGCAVKVYGQSYDDWVLSQAKKDMGVV